MGPEIIIPVFGILATVGIVGLIGKSVVTMARLRLEQTRAEGGGADAEVLAALATLRDQVDHLQQQLAETQERLEFTERLMIRDRSASRGDDA